MVIFIDNSQLSLYHKCPWAWWEKYVACRDRAWPEAQRSDALCLGSLVHSGLEQYSLTGQLTIAPEVVSEVTPTPDTLALAYTLVHGYIRAYPNEVWDIHRVEQPITFPLVGEAAERGIVGLAKVDAWFYNPELRELETGIPDYQTSIQAGYWIREYKTKGASVDRASWIQFWQTNMQASFQCLALDEHLNGANRRGYDPASNNHLVTAPIEGVLVSVLEKPKEYIPKRKCKGCAETIEMELFLSTGEGHACPLCGAVQKLTPYVPKVERVPVYYRVLATRQPAQLELDLLHISHVAVEMDKLRKGELDPAILANKGSCLDLRSRRGWGECVYYRAHIYGLEDDNNLIQIDPFGYVGLDKLEEAA